MVDIASISSGDGSPSKLQKGQMLISWFTPRELTCGYLLTSRPRVWIHTSTHPHMYTSTLFLFLLYLEWWETVIFLNQILFSINIQKCSKRLKGEVFFGCYFTHIDINRSKTILDSSGEAGIAVGTGSWLLSLPVFLFQCCLESAAQRLLKAKSLLLACDSFSLPFILFKCA